jgi:hypothetical protein
VISGQFFTQYTLTPLLFQIDNEFYWLGLELNCNQYQDQCNVRLVTKINVQVQICRKRQ